MLHKLIPAVLAAALAATVAAALAGRTDRDPLDPELHRPRAACAIADPGNDGLARLLDRPVPTRMARGRG